MVDSREKGSRGEKAVKDLLIKYTGLGWQRTPGSGALSAEHKLKGDLYVPEYPLRFCVEVKNYAECYLDSSILTSKNPMLLTWWSQAERQGVQVGKDPLLFFKHNRSKIFVAMPLAVECSSDKSMLIITESCDLQICVAEDWLQNTKINWGNNGN